MRFNYGVRRQALGCSALPRSLYETTDVAWDLDQTTHELTDADYMISMHYDPEKIWVRMIDGNHHVYGYTHTHNRPSSPLPIESLPWELCLM